MQRLTPVRSIRQEKSTVNELSLMQLPYMDANVVKKLTRSKVRRVAPAKTACFVTR